MSVHIVTIMILIGHEFTLIAEENISHRAYLSASLLFLSCRYSSSNTLSLAHVFVYVYERDRETACKQEKKTTHEGMSTLTVKCTTVTLELNPFVPVDFFLSSSFIELAFKCISYTSTTVLRTHCVMRTVVSC